MKFLVLVVLCVLPLISVADSCQKIVLDENRADYKVYASATKGLHIKFWEEVKFGILSNDVIWKAHSNPTMKDHFWLFSKNMSTENNEVGSTFIMSSGKTVNLVVQQKLDAPSCLLVNDSANQSVIIADFSNDTKKVADIESANPLITSSYIYDKSRVRSAYDDSRFTHVQLNGFSQGDSLYSVIAVTGDKKRVISNPQFDSRTNTYTLPGIHDLLMFEYNNDSFEVKRN